MSDAGRLALGAWFVLTLVSIGAAHVPIPHDGTEIDADHAISLDDVGLSRVIYYEITTESPRVWLTFEAEAGQELYLKLGVPFIDRLKDSRPAMAVLGPTLPPVSVPFEIPAGLGGLTFTTDNVTQPEFFHEPFTGTDSWSLSEQTLALPAAGRYYVVAYVPSGQTGKLWVAIGRREEFGLEDILGLPATIAQVREFHEVGSAGGLPCFLLPVAAALPAMGLARFVRRRSAAE